MAYLKPSTYVIGIIIFVFAIMAGVSMIGEFRTESPEMIASSELAAFNTTFNVYDKLSTSVTSMQTTIEPPSNIWDAIDVLGQLVRTAINGIQLLLTTFGFMNVVFAGFGIMGIPTWVGTLISWFIIVSFVFTIWSAMSNKEL